MTDTPNGADPAAEFAALMSSAAEHADTDADTAPYGYTKDAETGEMRPKRAPGRPRRQASLEELRESAAADADDDAPQTAHAADDRPPEQLKKRRGKVREPGSREPVPAYRAGLITTGVNRLYRRAGKIVRAMDSDIGEAIIQSARNTAGPDEPDDSVGAAWDELARTNPRVRKFLLKVIAGGAWGQLVMAHAPIAMAIMMKPAILRVIPFSRFIESMAEPDEDTPDGEGGLPGGMTAADAGEMARLAAQQIERMGMSIPPEVAAQMAAAAESMMNGGGVPAAAAGVRHQPRRPAARGKRKAAA